MNQIVDCPDAEALEAFKHSVRDEWLARHLGQEGPKSMTALTALMTRFAREKTASSLVEATAPTPRAHPKSETATASLDEANTTVAMIMKDHATQRSMPDLAIPSPANERSHSRRIETNHPT